MLIQSRHIWLVCYSKNFLFTLDLWGFSVRLNCCCLEGSFPKLIFLWPLKHLVNNSHLARAPYQTNCIIHPNGCGILCVPISVLCSCSTCVYHCQNLESSLPSVFLCFLKWNKHSLLRHLYKPVLRHARGRLDECPKTERFVKWWKVLLIGKPSQETKEQAITTLFFKR